MINIRINKTDREYQLLKCCWMVDNSYNKVKLSREWNILNDPYHINDKNWSEVETFSYNYWKVWRYFYASYLTSQGNLET